MGGRGPRRRVGGRRSGLRLLGPATLIGVVLVVSVLPACGEEPSPFTEAWSRNGEPVPEERLQVYRGSEHCGWTSAVLLHVGWPVGGSVRVADGGRQYVRDATDVVPGVDAPQVVDDLPGDAEPSGLSNAEGVSLWFSDSRPDAAYLRLASGRVEVWPRVDSPMGCD